MGTEFEDQDLSDAVFWCVDLRRAHFRDVDLTGVSIGHARLVDVDIDGTVERLTVNGVDVTAYVNEHDRWYPLRAMLRPAEPDGMRAAWRALDAEWSETIERVRQLPEARRHESVGGEWSCVDTLRHLVFAIDKWFTVPVLGDRSFHPLGLPNTGSIGFGWPGLEPASSPTFDAILAARAERGARFATFLEHVAPDDLGRRVEVLENGEATVADCLRVVFEEEFEHHRYAIRDLAHLE